MKTIRYTMGGSLAALLAITGGVSEASGAGYADIVVVVDESGSMSGEHAWLPTMISSLEAKLQLAGVGTGVDPNRYSLVGFGGGGASNGGRTLLNSGTTAQFGTAATSLVISGNLEDGYSGINFALNNITQRAGAALNFILVTDEDRDINAANTLTKAGIEAALDAKNALLNVVVDNPFSTAAQANALGMAFNLTAYFANGLGGYTTGSPGIVGNGNGNTETDYVPLAFSSGGGGAAWNLNLLRAGGNSAVSFTEAFVDLKVQEIVNQPPPDLGVVPEASTIGSAGAFAGMMGYIMLRRRQTKTQA